MASTVRLLTASLLWLAATQFAIAQPNPSDGEIVRSGTLTEQPNSPALRSDAPTAVAALPEAAAHSISRETKPLPLAARSKSGKDTAQRSTIAKPAESLITMGGSLCVVLSLFFGAAWLLRKGSPRNVNRLPTEIVEVLGKMPLVKGQDMQLVRIGAKLLLICITPHGCETLTEITDEAEVDRLAAVCRRNNPNSVTAAFNQVLHAVGREPASGFAGNVRTAANSTAANDRRGVRYHA